MCVLGGWRGICGWREDCGSWRGEDNDSEYIAYWDATTIMGLQVMSAISIWKFYWFVKTLILRSRTTVSKFRSCISDGMVKGRVSWVHSLSWIHSRWQNYIPFFGKDFGFVNHSIYTNNTILGLMMTRVYMRGFLRLKEFHCFTPTGSAGSWL